MYNNFKAFAYLGYRFLDYIYSDYLQCRLKGVQYTQSDAETKFYERYINPAIEENKDKGYDMETLFSTVLALSCEEDFKNGFKACLQFISECMESCMPETKKGDTED